VRNWSRTPSAADALLFAQVAALALCAPFVMRLPLPRVAALLEPRRTPAVLTDEAQRHRLRVADLALWLTGRVRRQDCLSRGLTRFFVLRRCGVDVALAFGIGEPRPGLTDGHCWLVRDGQPFLEGQDPRPHFVEMYRIAPSTNAC
jgi:Transglutaminase-like superfamily